MEAIKSKATSYYQNTKSWLTLKKAILLGVGLILLFFLSLVIYVKSTPIVLTDSFAVIFSSPEYSSNTARPDIILHFNQPVDPKHAEHFITIDPPIPGEWVQGGTPNIIYLTPTQNLPRNNKIKVTVNKGFPSRSGEKLSADFKYEFSVYYEADRIALVKGDVEGRVFSFPQKDGAKFTLKVVGSYNTPSVKVYKASVNDLLNSLTYTLGENDKYNQGFTQGTFKNSKIDTSSLKLVKEFKDLSLSSEISFNSETGLYLFESLNGDTPINQTWVTLNNSGAHFRQDDQDFYLAPQDLISGEAQSGFKANFYTLKDSVQKIGNLDLDGIAKFHLEYPKRLDLVTIEKGSDVIIIPVDLPESLAQIRTNQNLRTQDRIFLYTDRPIYRQGDVVKFRGLVRGDNDAIYSNSLSKTVHVYLDVYDNSGNASKKIVDLNLNLEVGGKFSGEFKLPDDFQGSTSLTATTKSDTEGENYNSSTYASFEVYEYVKPEFGLDVNLDRDEYIRGDEIMANVKGYYFDGRPLSNQKVFVSAYKNDFFETEKKVYSKSFNITGWGGMCGGGGFEDYLGSQIGSIQEVSLDKNGNGQFKLKTKDLDSKISQKITIVADKNYRRDEQLVERSLRIEDQNYEEQQKLQKERITSAKTAVVHSGDFNIFIMPFTKNVNSGEEFTAYFYSESLLGEKLTNKEFKYTITEEVYDSTTLKNKSKVLKQGSVVSDSEGIGKVVTSMTSDNGNSYYLNVEASDQKGNNIVGSAYFYVYKKDPSQYVYNPYYGLDDTLLKIVSEESNLTPGNFASININSPTDLNVFVTFDRGRVYAPQWLKLTKGDNVFRFHVADEFMPSITPTFSYFYNGGFRAEGLTFNVPAMKKLVTVEISADKASYNPGDTAALTITTKNHEGVPVSAQIGASVVDKAIYALKKRAESPLHSSFYYLRNRTTNISSSLTWVGNFNGGRGGGGGGGGGATDFSKDVDTLYWNPNLRTGEDGKLTIQIPVGKSKTTWKALIYASTDDTKLGQNDYDFLVSDIK